MTKYIFRRLFLIVPTMLLVSMLIFSLVRLMPGDVVLQQLSESPSYDPKDVAALRHKLGIDRPIYEQYPKWVWGIVKGDLGTSLWSQRPISDEILEALPTTLELAFIAFFLVTIVALALGVVSAARPESALDRGVRLLSITGLSIPGFWVATIVIIFAAKYMQYSPPLRYVSFVEDPVTNLKQFLLPAAIIAVADSGRAMRMVRSEMLEVLRQDYVRTAWSKGLRERQVIYRHVLKNALLPVVTLQGFLLGHLIAGQVIIEIIFGLPGIGRLTYVAIQTRDYTVIQAAVLVFGALFLLINLTVDLMYGYLDPRISYS